MRVPLSVRYSQKLFQGMTRDKGKINPCQKTLKVLISELETLWNPGLHFRFQSSYPVLPKKCYAMQQGAQTLDFLMDHHKEV